MTSLVHRHCAAITQSPMVIHQQSFVYGFDVVVADVFECSVRQVGRALKQRIGSFFAHGRMVAEAVVTGNSHFPIPFLFVHGANVPARQE